jgi:hypothetical protein
VEGRITGLLIALDARRSVGVSSDAGRLAVFESTDGEVTEGSRARGRERLSFLHAAGNTRAVHLEDGGAFIRSGESSTSTHVITEVGADTGPSSLVGIGRAVNGGRNLSH